METYSSDVSYIIRQDFLRFSVETPTPKISRAQAKIAREKRIEADLEASRREMMNDDGLGSIGRYKCPIF